MYEDEDASEKTEEVMENIEENKLEGTTECEVCKQIFFMQHDFESHICNKTAKHVSCPICQKTFQFSFRLKHHLRTHSKQKFYECDICKERFADKNHIATHLKNYTDVIKRYKCEVCEKTYRNASTLKEHMYTHTGEKPHKCEQCGKQFMVESLLKAHLATHKDKKKFECKICEMDFSYKSSLNEHMKTHSKKKTFKCDECGKTYTRKSSLLVHIKCIHSNDTSIIEKCHVCNKQFKHKPQLKQHLKIHSNDKCLVCLQLIDQCTCSKSPKSDWRDPLRDNLMFTCQTCFKPILSKCQLRKHLEIHRDYKCLVCNEDYRNCTCSDDYIVVPKSKSTYQKRNKPETNVDDLLTEKIVDSRVVFKEEPYTLQIKEEIVDNEEKLISEIIKPKEEPKEEDFEIGESSVESFTFVNVKIDEDGATFNIKEEPIES